jgi:hypothetical protein
MELDLFLLASASDHFINMSFCDLKEQDDKESLSLSSHDRRLYPKNVLVGFLHIDMHAWITIFSFTALLQLSHDFACNYVPLPVGDTAISFECMTCLEFEEESIWITRTIEILDNFIIAKFLC